MVDEKEAKRAKGLIELGFQVDSPENLFTVVLHVAECEECKQKFREIVEHGRKEK